MYNWAIWQIHINNYHTVSIWLKIPGDIFSYVLYIVTKVFYMFLMFIKYNFPYLQSILVFFVCMFLTVHFNKHYNIYTYSETTFSFQSSSTLACIFSLTCVVLQQLLQPPCSDRRSHNNIKKLHHKIMLGQIKVFIYYLI